MPEAHQKLANAQTDAVVLGVTHDRFRDFDFSKFTKDNVVVFDIKGFIDRSLIDGRL